MLYRNSTQKRSTANEAALRHVRLRVGQIDPEQAGASLPRAIARLAGDPDLHRPGVPEIFVGQCRGSLRKHSTLAALRSGLSESPLAGAMPGHFAVDASLTIGEERLNGLRLVADRGIPPLRKEHEMSIFGSIMSKIFHTGTAAAATPDAPAAAPGAAPAAGSAPAATPGAAATPVDVIAVCTALDEKQDEELNWKTSIVDLMKLLKLDSSLTARKELAKELNYTGDTDDSATMNVWLHKQVMQKLAANGGVVPDSMKH
jgi:hypothetical protein